MRTILLAAATMLAASTATAAAQTVGTSPQEVHHQTTLDRVRARGFVQCGSQERPGLAMQDGKGEWRGLEVEICRAVATTALGPKARYAFHKYEADNDYASVRDGADQVSFSTLAEMTDHKVTDKLAPGPTVFIETHDLIVAEDSPAKRAADLRMASICFLNESAPNASLDAWFETRKIPIVRFGFREDGEMYDAYEVQRCQAVVGEATELARERLHGGPNDLKSRFLPDHLATYPIVAATPVSGDAQWSAIVAWTIDTLIAASVKETYYTGGGLRIIPVAGTGLGLAADWQKALLATVGTYDDIFRRTLGEGSPFKLAPGLNAPVAEGGFLLAPFEEQDANFRRPSSRTSRARSGTEAPRAAETSADPARVHPARGWPLPAADPAARRRARSSAPALQAARGRARPERRGARPRARPQAAARLPDRGRVPRQPARGRARLRAGAHRGDRGGHARRPRAVARIPSRPRRASCRAGD